MPGHPSQESPGTSGAYRLDGGAGAPDASAVVIEFTPVVEKWFGVLRVGGNQHPLDAHIHPDDAHLSLRFRDLDLVGKEQIPLLPHALDLGIFPTPFGERAGVKHLDKLAENCQTLVGSGKVPSVREVHHWPSEYRQFPRPVGFGGFVGCTYPLKQTARKLGGKSHFSNARVMLLLQLLSVQLSGLKDDTGNPIQGVEPHGQEGIHIGTLSELQLNGANRLHFQPYYTKHKRIQQQNTDQQPEGAIPPTAKAVGFLVQDS
jgi:hypothetical protein